MRRWIVSVLCVGVGAAWSLVGPFQHAYAQHVETQPPFSVVISVGPPGIIGPVGDATARPAGNPIAAPTIGVSPLSERGWFDGQGMGFRSRLTFPKGAGDFTPEGDGGHQGRLFRAQTSEVIDRGERSKIAIEKLARARTWWRGPTGRLVPSYQQRFAARAAPTPNLGALLGVILGEMELRVATEEQNKMNTALEDFADNVPMGERVKVMVSIVKGRFNSVYPHGQSVLLSADDAVLGPFEVFGRNYGMAIDQGYKCTEPSAPGPVICVPRDAIPR